MVEERNSGNEYTKRWGRFKGVEEGWGGENVRIRRRGEKMAGTKKRQERRGKVGRETEK